MHWKRCDRKRWNYYATGRKQPELINMIKPNEATNIEGHTDIGRQVDPLVMRGEYSRRVLTSSKDINWATLSAPFPIAIVIFRPRV